MTDTLKKTIIDDNAVIRCLDPEMLRALRSHATFLFSDLRQELKRPINLKLSMQKLDAIFCRSRSNGGYDFEQFYRDITESIVQTTAETSTILNMLIDGKECSILQPDGTGWQKGKIKLCIEFIPEETEVLEKSSNLPTAKLSPLDEIRNSIAVETN